ncbi:MAG: cupredoxin domain-containing protein [Candidatus Uhrbacteria bacterium]|nr:cupredoxin domain-containing protein [Candidatus Uhrbacteria bacterium]
MNKTTIATIGLGSLLMLGAGCATAQPMAPSPAPAAEVPAANGSSTATVPPTPAPSAPLTKPQAAPMPTPPPVQKPLPPKNQTVIVTIKNFAFSPQVIAVNDGDTVMWVNADPVSHTSTFDGALLWDSGNLVPGASYKRVFHVGTYQYHCGPHPNMKGTIIVR